MKFTALLTIIAIFVLAFAIYTIDNSQTDLYAHVATLTARVNQLEHDSPHNLHLSDWRPGIVLSNPTGVCRRDSADSTSFTCQLPTSMDSQEYCTFFWGSSDIYPGDYQMNARLGYSEAESKYFAVLEAIDISERKYVGYIFIELDGPSCD